MTFPLVNRISFLLLFIFILEGKICGQDLWDKVNLEDRRLAHRRLFDEYIKDKKCVFSEDRLSLCEVVIYDAPTKFTKTCEVKLPKGTRDVSRNFNQLVIRGKSLSSVTVSLGIGQYAISLPRVHGTAESLAVFKLVNVIRPNSIKDGMDENREFGLQIRSQNPAILEEISLRFTGGGISKDFESQQQNLMGFGQDRIGKIREEFFRSTVARSFDELSDSLNEESDAFDRIITSASFGAGTQNYQIKGVLVDRRVSKLHEGLSRMDPNVADQVAKKLFVNAFESYCESFLFADILPVEENYSLQAHLFLCSEFCSPKLAMEQIDRWDTWYAANLENGITPSAGLDKIFSMNLQINVIRTKNNWSIQRVNEFLATEFGPSFKIGGNGPPTVEWSALPSSDWTPKQIELLRLVPVFYHTSALVNPNRHEFILETLRNELLDLK